jgi:hypothetical protein
MARPSRAAAEGENSVQDRGLAVMMDPLDICGFFSLREERLFQVKT